MSKYAVIYESNLKFAILPTLTKEGWVWLKWYRRIQVWNFTKITDKCVITFENHKVVWSDEWPA